MTRTDIHRPSAAEFDPEAYDCFGVFDLNPDPFWGAGEHRARTQAVNAAVKMGYGFAAHQSGGQCGHCGAAIRYAALMLHEASKEMIYIGETCLDNRFEALTKSEFQALRVKAKLNKDRATTKDRFAANLAKAVEVEPSLAVLGTDDYEKYGFFVADVRSKLFKWELSPRQIAAVAKSIARQEAWDARKAEEAKTASPVPVTDTRFEIVGEIISIKEVPDNYSRYGGTVTKVTVKDDRGFRVYGTLASDLAEALYNRWYAAEEAAQGEYFSLQNYGSDYWQGSAKGARIRFTAKVKVSPDDKTFGWFSRPTKASVVKEVAEAVAA